MTENEELKKLAIERMEILKAKGLAPNVVNEFKKSNKVYFSRRSPLGGILYWTNDAGGFPRECQSKLNELQADGSIVYHVTNEVTSFGECYDFLLVSPEDLEYGNDDFKESGYAFAYVMNITEPICSEFGTVQVKPAAGGLIRIG